MFAKVLNAKKKMNNLQAQTQSISQNPQSLLTSGSGLNASGLNAPGLLSLGSAVTQPSNKRNNMNTSNNGANNNRHNNNKNTNKKNTNNGPNNNGANNNRPNNNGASNSRASNSRASNSRTTNSKASNSIPVNTRRSGQTKRQDKHIIYVKDQQYELTTVQTNALAKLVDSAIRKMANGVSHVQLNKIVQSIEALPEPNNMNNNNNI